MSLRTLLSYMTLTINDMRCFPLLIPNLISCFPPMIYYPFKLTLHNYVQEGNFS
uniref:Uncharacterized protein n=1 Tax=Rhizophora mucronata TaxID=61149 RepID=A0A2P2QNK8_RHIMU